MKTLVDTIGWDDERWNTLNELHQLMVLARRKREEDLGKDGDNRFAEALVEATTKMLSTPKYTWEQAFYAGLMAFLDLAGDIYDENAMNAVCLHSIQRSHLYSVGDLARNLRHWAEFHGLDIFKPQ